MESREIKFRAWDARHGKMFVPKKLEWNRDGVLHFWNEFGQWDEDMVLIRFTGLLDKNGIEIYEQTIFHLGEPKILYIVEFQGGCFVGRQISNASTVGLAYWQKYIELIGDAHQNPELLEKSA